MGSRDDDQRRRRTGGLNAIACRLPFDSAMHQYILRRLIQTVPVLFLFSIVVFTVMRLVPGDPATVILGLEATPEAVAQIRDEMGLDEPIVVQYGYWLRDI